MSDSHCLCSTCVIDRAAELLVDPTYIDIQFPKGLSQYLCLDSPLLAVDEFE